MSFPGPGRKRVPNLERLSAEDEALSQVAREAEARLAAKRAARAEAREIRMKELERQQKEVSDDEERMSAGSRGSLRPSDHGGLLGSSSRASSRASSARASPVVEERTDFLDRGTRTMSALSAATLASLGGASRRGSCDTTFSLETEVSIREMKNSLAEAEEKYRRAMVSNALLHNEKAALMYQEEVLREELADTEELLWEARRHRDDVNKERERERREHGLLRVQFRDLKEALRQTEDLLMEASDLRLKTSSYCQEISDLQEALTWKEKQVGALERQRETSDIVRMERDRLRDDIVRLRDVLKRHGLHPPDITSNGESDRTNDDVDDVTAESSFRLAEQAPQGMLGKAPAWQAAKRRKPSPSDVKASQKVCRRSQLLSTTSDQTRVARERRSAMEKSPGRSKRAEKDPGKKLPARADVLPSTEGAKKRAVKDEPGAPIPDSPSPVPRALKSGLVPPRSAKEILLENRGIVLSLLAAGQLNFLPSKTPHPDAAELLEHKALPCCSEFELASAVDDGSSSWRCSEVRDVGTQTSEKRLKEARCVNLLVREEDAIESETKLHHHVPEGSGTSEELEEPKTKEVQEGHIHQKCPEVPGPSDPACLPEEMWTSLEKAVQGRLQGSAGNQAVVAEVSRIFSEILTSLHRWSLDLENTLNIWVEESNQHPGGGRRSAGHVQDPERSVEERLPLMHLQVPEGPDQGRKGRVLDPQTSKDESGSSTAEETFHLAPALPRSFSGDFVFIESYFSEPLQLTAGESRCHQRSGDSSSPTLQRGAQGSARDPQALTRGPTPLSTPQSRQSSRVRRLIETTAEEIRTMAVPELTLLHLQEEPPRVLHKLAPSDAGSPEELSAGDTDSCEEADEEAVPPAPEGAETVVGVGDVRPAVDGVKPRRGQAALRLAWRHKTRECKLS